MKTRAKKSDARRYLEKRAGSALTLGMGRPDRHRHDKGGHCTGEVLRALLPRSDAEVATCPSSA